MITPGRRLERGPGVFLLAYPACSQEPQRPRKGDLVRLALPIIFRALGTLARYGLQGVAQARTRASFPAGTLVVNLLGCFLLSGIAEYGLTHLSFPPEWRIGITIGFFGAFTTFSTSSWETAKLLEDGEWMRAGIYVAASVLGGLIAVILGIHLSDRL